MGAGLDLSSGPAGILGSWILAFCSDWTRSRSTSVNPGWSSACEQRGGMVSRTMPANIAMWLDVGVHGVSRGSGAGWNGGTQQ